jgi:hypothetical protein
MCKSSKENDPHDEYVPPVTGEDSDEDDEFHAAEMSGDELMPGDFEVEDLEGNVTVVICPSMTKDEVQAKVDEVIALARSDERFQVNTNKRQLRFDDIIKTGVSRSNFFILLTSVTNLPTRKLLAASDTRVYWISQITGRA